MATKKRLIIHVGLPKCGSTSLQAVFPQCNQITYWGKTVEKKFVTEDLCEFTRIIAHMSDVRLVGARRMKIHFAALLEKSSCDVVVLSDEVLSSVGLASGRSSLSLPQIIENFNHVLPCMPEVVLVVREQRSFLKSYYRQHVRSGSPETYQEFIELMLMDKYRFLRPLLNYAAVTNAIRPLVSKLHVLVFEKLFFDVAYCREAFSNLGIDQAAALLAETHMLPAKNDQEILEYLRLRFPHIWAASDPWYRKTMFPTIHQTRLFTTSYSQTATSYP